MIYVFLSDFQSHSVLSLEAKNAAAEIVRRLQLGSKLSDVIQNKKEALALFNLYRNEGYILTEHGGKFCVRKLLQLGFSLYLHVCIFHINEFFCKSNLFCEN